MVKELFVNAAIIIATISIGNQILINEEITSSSPLKIRVFFGCMSGILGIILMLYSINVVPNVIMDFRNITIVLSATYCGFLGALITGLILGLFRLLFQGLTFSSILATLGIVAIAISCALTTKYIKKRSNKWIILSLYTLIYPTIVFIMVIQSRILLMKTILIYWISTVVASVVVFVYLQFIDILRFTFQKYQQDSTKDHRTGLNNVRQFDKEFNRIVNGLTDKSIITMLFIDIDHFKKVNDVHGHRNGDQVLEDLGKILLNTTNSNDIVSRNGGEEFSVIMTDCPRDKVLGVAERIRREVQDHKFLLLNAQSINITISIGVAIYPFSVNNIQEIVEKADSALYEAKRTGRNKVVVCKSIQNASADFSASRE
ncbi:Diguanylate cyclase (GGDEF) domain-containing protein [Candidatus Desulfosporosinus infrequens]|uniref:Diguanylate cyclase (GGDEF) domain-containing protein n=1 Tax=Candidatus Desulfosporosinus infrequens TaxID=2043169 RepID=A0A2U3JWW6_9FIRM|nr:Diguanylate cyclase (GGDEF) domain-containing protein [Candidatus Desulfosporosinus infrequens]